MLADLPSRVEDVEPILIRYDGLDADRHEIEMAALADSIKGISRIVGVSGNFLVTGDYAQHKDALAVRVMASRPQEGCFQILASLVWLSQNPLIATALGTAMATLITYIFTRSAGKKEEMKQLRMALETAIKELGQRDQPHVDRFLATIDKMADALRPATRQAVGPIGQTVSRLTVGSTREDGQRAVMEQAERDAILDTDRPQVGPEKNYDVIITELDLENGNCKLSPLGETGGRISGKITDPALGTINNAYALAMASHSPINVTAKPVIRDGELDKLFISNSH